MTEFFSDLVLKLAKQVPIHRSRDIAEVKGNSFIGKERIRDQIMTIKIISEKERGCDKPCQGRACRSF
jgi:hypothetical protein